MVCKLLLKAGIKKHKGILTGVFLLTLLVSLCLCTVLTVWINSSKYINNELSRAGFGTLTAWVAGVPNISELAFEIEKLDMVNAVKSQDIIFSSYEANGKQSDSEGQLITYAAQENRYRFFTPELSQYTLSAPALAAGEIYVSPSLISMFNISVGDSISFAIARNGESMAFTVKGFYEDPFMGSAMIGMKGFLISLADSNSINDIIKRANIDALARTGAMLHVFENKAYGATSAQLNSTINQSTSLPRYTEFVYSKAAISGFMLVLQNAFSGLLIAFVIVLLAVVLVALGHGITSNIDADYVNMGILKAVGVSGAGLRQIQLLQFAVAILPSLLLGAALSVPLSRFASRAMLTTTGVLMPSNFPCGACLGTLALLLVILFTFIALKTARIDNISPVNAIRYGHTNAANGFRAIFKISGTHLALSLAARQLIAGKKKYISACLVAVLLVFFACTIGRISSWLGADGKGMMDAFNPADHDIGVQMLGQQPLSAANEIALAYTQITDSYQLAMVSASVNGVDYTANVITQPNRFHILKGQAITASNEIVITQFVAADLGVWIGDTVLVASESGNAEFVICGIYSCANEMGDNIGMSREGYLRIAQDNPQIWCEHYFLEDSTKKADITQALTARFGGDVHVHENTWTGLEGIISAMQALVVFMYAMVVLFILIITTMTAGKILKTEQADIGIYKAIGFTLRRLQLSFALRFAIVAILGAVIGSLMSWALTDIIVSGVMKYAGISNFASNPSILVSAFPVAFVALLFFSFAYLASGNLKKVALSVLIKE